jgi:hypothetical protein
MGTLQGGGQHGGGGGGGGGWLFTGKTQKTQHTTNNILATYLLKFIGSNLDLSNIVKISDIIS